MLRFRHSPIVRTLALVLTLNLTLWSCASAPKTEAERLANQGIFMAPVPVDSLVQFARTPSGTPWPYMLVTLTDSAMVSLDGSEPEFHGGEVIELRDFSSRADTLLGSGGPPGPGVKHAYLIPRDEIGMLQLTRSAEERENGGGNTVGIVIGAVLGAALVVGLVIVFTQDACIDTGLGEC